MISRRARVRAGTAAGVLIGSALAARMVFAPAAVPRPSRLAVTQEAAFDSGSATVRGTLTPAALHAISATQPAARLLIVLRKRDRLVCEDLGRQLRELLGLRDAHGAVLILTEDSAVSGYRVFARREHLRVAVEPLSPAALLVGQPRLPTPAVLVVRGGEVEGIAHPARFPNLRMRSFATELKGVLGGSTSLARSGRDQIQAP